MLVTPLCIAMLVMPALSKAYEPIDVTPAGILYDSSLLPAG